MGSARMTMIFIASNNWTALTINIHAHAIRDGLEYIVILQYAMDLMLTIPMCAMVMENVLLQIPVTVRSAGQDLLVEGLPSFLSDLAQSTQDLHATISIYPILNFQTGFVCHFQFILFIYPF